MLLWLTLAALAAAVSFALMRSARTAVASSGHAGDIAVYRDQLTELDADAARGLIPADEADAARTEIARRMLAAADSAADPTSQPYEVRSRQILTLAAAAIPLLSLALYLKLGAPGLPDRPLAARIEAPLDPNVAPEINDMMAKLEARLRDHPEDGRGWALIAPAYLGQGRALEAASAYERAITYSGETVERLAGLAQANLVLGNGIVNEVARTAYLKALQRDAASPEARFWLAVYEEQNGRPEAAIDAYRKLKGDLAPESPWRGAAEQRLGELTGAKADSAARDPSPAPTAQGAPAAAPRKEPTPAEFVAAAQKLAPEMREAMIGGRMIPKAEAAVKLNPKDLRAWSRLVTGHAALGHAVEARAALGDARKAAGDDTPMLSSLDTLAKELGLDS